MLYSLIICIAYIIGIIWGLYLDLYLSVVSFFLIICASLVTISFLQKNKEKTKIVRNISIIILISYLLGYTNISIRKENFSNKYKERSFQLQRRDYKFYR